ncbi:hypothetical protein ACS0TY_013471 [Phlomoides rotata]
MDVLRWKTQDSILLTKASKRSPLILRMVILILSIISALFIFSICINQTHKFPQFNPLRIQTMDHRTQLCRDAPVQDLDLPYLHFPQPQTFSRQECGCNPVLYFAIVSMQRSGSGWFETLLNSHMNLSSNGEIFGPRERRNSSSVIYQTLDKVYNLDWWSSASKNDCSAAVGFKWMLNQGLMEYHEEIRDYLNRRGVSLIFLFRRNLLRRMVSLVANSYVKLLNGTHKSHVHSPQEAKVLARYKPTLNVTVLVSNLKSAEQMYFLPPQKLVDVQEFLKLPTRNLTSLQVKIHSGPLSQQINNFDDVRKALEGTPYQHFIHSRDSKL